MIEQRLIEAFSSPDESERRSAAREVSESCEAEATELLVSQLRVQTSRAVKEAILRGLSRMWTTSPVESMIELLRDDDPFVRAEGAAMLQRRASDVIEALCRLVRSEDRDLRKFSVYILREAIAGAPDALYLAALKDEDINVVISAIENIGSRQQVGFSQQVIAVAMESSQPMAVCAAFEALAQIGNKDALEALRKKYPDAALMQGFYLQPFLKLLGRVAGPESIEEICRTIQKRGELIHDVAIDAVQNIASRRNVTKLNEFCEGTLCGLLTPNLDRSLRSHLLDLLGHFTESSRVALAVLPYIHDSDPFIGLAAIKALTNSSDPVVETALHALSSAETDPDIREEQEELLRRRPRWNSPPSSSPN